MTRFSDAEIATIYDKRKLKRFVRKYLEQFHTKDYAYTPRSYYNLINILYYDMTSYRRENIFIRSFKSSYYS